MATKTINDKTAGPPREEVLRERAKKLGLFGLLSQWKEFADDPLIERVLDLEEGERQRRSLERRLRAAKVKRFKPIADFDWKWPTKIDRDEVDDLFSLDFLADNANVVFVGPNGVGKTMIALNIAHLAVMRGHTVLTVGASDLVKDLDSQESSRGLQRRLRHYLRPQLLLIDELGYLSGTARQADLLFEVVSRRYQEKSTVVTTNKPFSEWNTIFPNAGCVVTMVDRLVHKAEIVQIEGESYRLKEAKERAAQSAKRRSSRKAKG
jgi:DNA replication protein DnaC